MSEIKICVYAICKNEEKNIINWMKRMDEKDDHPDLVVILDTGSNDLTVPKIWDECHLSNKETDINMSQHTPKFFLYKERPTGELYDENDINFSVMRNDALSYARNVILNILKEDISNLTNWVMVSLDIDEFPNDNFFNNIRKIWHENNVNKFTKVSYDVMKITGITYNENSVSTQIVEHKVHTFNENWKWVRRVHEIIQLNGGIKQKDWRKLDASNEVSYTHKQDLSKKRDYYSLLKKELLENPDATTTIYCAWEAALHGEIDFSDELNRKCKSIIISDDKDEHYHDWEYYIQCCINLAMHNKENIKLQETATEKLKVIKKSIDDLSEAIAIMEDKRFFKLRRVYGELAFLYMKAGDIVFTEEKNEIKKDRENGTETVPYPAYDYMIEGFYKKAISSFREVLSIKDRPYCWIEDDFFYDNDKMYVTMMNICLSLLELYKESTADFSKHIGVIADAIGCNSLLVNSPIEIRQDIHNKLMNLFEYYNNLLVNGPNGEPTDIGEKINNIKTSLDEKGDTTNMNSENKIAIYAICKNEAQFVEKWMESMMEADLIVVCDTGSTDNTVEELMKYKSDKVWIYNIKVDPWRFDVARNMALDMVPNDYNILVSTDLDEILEPGWSNVLREKWISGVHERGIYKYSWSHLENGESGRVFQYDKVHSRKWRWKYPVHELLYNVDTGSNLYNQEEVLYIFDEMHLHHYPDRTKSRGNYLPLLELRKAEDPNDYYGLVYLAHEYFYQRQYENSIRTLTEVLNKFSEQYTTVEEASCYLFMGDAYHELGDNSEAIYNYLKAIFTEPTYREPYLNLAKVYLDLKDYSLAEGYVKLAINKSYRHYTWLERDNSWSWEPYDLLSLACFYGGKKRDSLAYAVKAYQYDTENERLRNNVNVILENMSETEMIQ